MEAKYGRAQRIWAVDRGRVSEANLKFLRDRDRAYIVGTPKALLHQSEQHLMEKDWHEAQEGVEVKLVAGPEGQEVAAGIADTRNRRRISGSSNAWRRPRRRCSSRSRRGV